MQTDNHAVLNTAGCHMCAVPAGTVIALIGPPDRRLGCVISSSPCLQVQVHARTAASALKARNKAAHPVGRVLGGAMTEAAAAAATPRQRRAESAAAAR